MVTKLVKVGAEPLALNMPEAIVLVAPPKVKAVESTASLLPLLLTLKAEEKVPAVLVRVEVEVLSNDKVKLLPPKVPPELWV